MRGILSLVLLGAFVASLHGDDKISPPASDQPAKPTIDESPRPLTLKNRATGEVIKGNVQWVLRDNTFMVTLSSGARRYLRMPEWEIQETGGTVAKNKTTGQTLRGVLTKQKINGLSIFIDDAGEKHFLSPDEWEFETGQAFSSARPGDVRAYFIPLDGPIESPLIVSAIKLALQEARSRGAEWLIFRMNTPGGRIDVADMIIQEMNGITWARTVAWVQGREKRALSAGAYICLSADKVYMASGTTIGAATPFRITDVGPEVEEKMTSAFRARFRALSEKRGWSAALADAMVGAGNSVVQVWVDSGQMLVTEEEASRLEREHKKDQGFRRGKIIVEKGKVLTLTCEEAREYGLSSGVVEDAKTLFREIGVDEDQVATAMWFPDWVRDHTNRTNRRIEELTSRFVSAMDIAATHDPRNQTYVVDSLTNEFADGGRLWREKTKNCEAYVEYLLRLLDAIESLPSVAGSARNIGEKPVNSLRVELKAWLQRLQGERNIVRLPG